MKMDKEWPDVESRLLETSEESCACKSRDDKQSKSSISMSALCINCLVTLLAVNILFLGLNCIPLVRNTNHAPRLQSPAVEAISYRQDKASHWQSPYSGPPTPENIKAWEDIIQPTFFSASKEEVINSGMDPHEAVKLAKGGYLASLGVYHEIHCLRQLRLFLFSDVFYPHLTDENVKYLQHHLGHCLEAIRESLMCKADITLYTFQWTPEDDDRPHPRTNTTRKCVQWDGLASWADQRKVSLDPILLRPSGQADKIHM